MVTVIRIVARILLRRQWQWLQQELLRRHAALVRNPSLAPPLVAQRLLVSGEDRRHGRHAGFDLYAMCRAVWRGIFQGRREGASTIEQQIVRVLTNRFEPTLARKIRELLLATLVADLLPKSATPSVYLSIGYYGWRMNSFGAACRRLELRANALSLDDAAGIVARLKYPEPRMAPPSRISQIQRRSAYLKRLYRGHLSDGTYVHLGGRNARQAVSGGRAVVESGRAPS